MQWYVSRNGETVGPIDEREVVEWTKGGSMQGAMLRDEASAVWIRLDQSPFAQFAPAPTAAEPKPTQRGRALLGFAIMGGAAVLVGWFLSVISSAGDRHVEGIGEPAPSAAALAATEPEEPPRPEHDILSAWVMSQRFVTQSLKSPSTADFGSLLGESQSADKQCTLLRETTYKCHGWVDAQNSFGATIRNDWTITLRYVGDETWETIEGPVLTAR